MSVTASTSSPAREKSYFDLHISGIGYLNRVRDVQPKKGETFLACDIAALNGPADNPERRRFDVRVSGKEAQHLVRRCKAAVDADRKVLIGFKLGDLWTDLFTHKKGKHAGEQDVSLKARLLYVGWIKVDGKTVYKAEPRNEDERPTDVPVIDPAPAESSDTGGDVSSEAPAPAEAKSF